MGKKRLTGMDDEFKRKEALGSAKRLEDFEYNDNSTADITDSENERQQMLADELQYEYSMRYHKAEDLLRGSDCVITYEDKARWLSKIGCEGIEIKDYKNPVSFEGAINAGYGKDVNRMFFREKSRLTKIRDESARYLF